jgi:hypothetical protein
MKHKILFKIHPQFIFHNKHKQLLYKNELDELQPAIQPQKRFEQLRQY